jgi:hypothetical protein
MQERAGRAPPGFEPAGAGAVLTEQHMLLSVRDNRSTLELVEYIVRFRPGPRLLAPKGAAR